jgi:phospholipase/lecithinase/hemolysin
LLASTVALLGGCASSKLALHEQSTRTTVDISRGNYRVVKTAAAGTSYGFRLLGIFPFASPSHAAARAKMYRSVGQDLTGRSIQIVNQLEDAGTTYLLLFSIPHLTITGDIVEFDREAPQAEGGAARK